VGVESEYLWGTALLGRLIGLVVLQGYCSSRTTICRGGSAISNTAGPEAPDQDESQPEFGDIEKPESRRKAVAGVEIGIMPEGQGSTFEPEEDRGPQG
jgi:hypothetical protein